MSIQYLVRSTLSNSRLKTVKLDASTTELGNAFQISQIRFVKKYLNVLTCESYQFSCFCRLLGVTDRHTDSIQNAKTSVLVSMLCM